MSKNQEQFDEAYEAIISQFDGTSRPDIPELEDYLSLLFEACNPAAYDPSNRPAIFTTAQYAQLFNYGFEALTDEDGETFYFESSPELEVLNAQHSYLIAEPSAISMQRSQAGNQAVMSEFLNLLGHAAGSASDELALYALGVIEDTVSSVNPNPAVLNDDYREIIAKIYAAFKDDGASEVVLDRLESLFSMRSETTLMIDEKGVAHQDKGKWSLGAVRPRKSL